MSQRSFRRDVLAQHSQVLVLITRWLTAQTGYGRHPQGYQSLLGGGVTSTVERLNGPEIGGCYLSVDRVRFLCFRYSLCVLGSELTS